MKRTSAFVASGLLTIAAGFAVAAPAAADYPPKAPSISVAGCSDVDSGVRVQVTDLLAGSSLTVEYDQVSGAAFLTLARTATSGSTTTTADASGTASTTLPIDEQGTYSVTALGTDAGGNDWTGTTSVEVVGACDDSVGGVGGGSGSGGSAGGASGGTGGLADTGSDNAALVAAGLGALLVGGGTVLIARRRRGTGPASA